MSWLAELAHDPFEPLLSSDHPAIVHRTMHELLGRPAAQPQAILWDLPIPRRILRKQQPDGSWSYPTKRARATTDYDQLETYRQIGFLVAMFRFTREHPAVERTAGYLFGKQTADGDIRGIYGSQPTPNYTAAQLELLVKAGYADDERVLKAFDWLRDYRLDDGGWALALRTQGRNLEAIDDKEPSRLDRSKPFSHLVTGVVLRAFAAHPRFRDSPEAARAARLLSQRFFTRDVYPDKNRVDDWTRFSFPFWQTDIVSSLDSISLIDPAMHGGPIDRARRWLVEHQEPSGLFSGHLLKDRFHDLQLWHSFAVCRIFTRMS